MSDTTRNGASGRTAVVLEPWPFCHEPIATLLARAGVTVVAAATSTRKALELVETHRPSVFVTELDVHEGTFDSLVCIERVRQTLPKVQVIVFSGREQPAAAAAARLAGASAFVSKATQPETLAEAFSRALSGGLMAEVSVAVEREKVELDPSPQLTPRELEILQRVAEGRSNRQVAQLLWVTDQTVKFHLANVYRKLGVGNRFEAAQRAREQGLLEGEPAHEVVLAGVAEGGSNGETRRLGSSS